MKKLLLTILACSSYILSFAQPGALDLTFDTGPLGPDNAISEIAIQSDGKLLVAGGFYYYLHSANDTTFTRLVRLNTDGTFDTTFHSAGPNYLIKAIAVQHDGRILIGGEFSSYHGTPVNHVCRIHPDGSLDTSFHIGTGFNNRILALNIQPDGKILAGGWFTEYNGIACNHLARLNADGSYDMTFNTTIGANSTVEDIALQPDGKILIAGDFTVYDSVHLPVTDIYSWRVARVNPDGSRDTSFVPALGADAAIYAVELQADGKIIIGGNFSSYNFTQRGRIARIDSDAALNAVFQTIPGVNHSVLDAKVLPGEKILFAGSFTSYGGIPAKHLLMFNPDGVIDTMFKIGTGPEKEVYAIAVQPDGKILIAGLFGSYNGTYRKHIARLYNCTTTQPGAITGSDSTLCTQTLVYSVPRIAGADRYEWTLPAGWTFSADSTSDSITVISNGQGGEISVRAFSDSCGYSDPQTKTVYRNQPPEQPICLVTVDELSTHNIIIWEKIRTNLIDSFFIYRETATNVYTKIASLPYDSLSEYHDYAANPNATSYRYKISSLDSCGVETALSPFHNTIHLQNFGSGNFQWTFYDIENAANPVTNFNIYRDAFGTGNFLPIGTTLTGNNNSFTDVGFDSFPNSQYVVDANWNISCTPQRGTVNTTRSNIRKVNFIDLPTGTGTNISPESIIIYPNPSENAITLNFYSPIINTSLQLVNSLGKIMWRESLSVNGGNLTISTETLSEGVYVLVIETIAGRLNRKVIIR